MATDTTQMMAVAAITPPGIEQAVAVICLAFSSDPAARWTYPDPHAYLTSFPRVVRAFGGKAFEHASAHQVSGFRGAALWLPPGVHPDQEALGAIMQESLAPDRLQEVSSVFERMGGYHPAEPHWYLPMIGVDPPHQGRGYGTALLRHALLQCDQEHVAAYLESSNPANVPLYERHGFVVCMSGTALSYPARFRWGRHPRSSRWSGWLAESDDAALCRKKISRRINGSQNCVLD